MDLTLGLPVANEMDGGRLRQRTRAPPIELGTPLARVASHAGRSEGNEKGAGDGHVGRGWRPPAATPTNRTARCAPVRSGGIGIGPKGGSRCGPVAPSRW